jgi:NADH-quinone oxidoreductase subunit J
MIDQILFYALAGVALASAVVVIAQRNPVYSAFALIVTLCSLSGIYGLLGSPFIAVLQIIVYAGAIMVLFLFVLMLLNVKQEQPDGNRGHTLQGVAVALAVLFALQVGTVLARVGVHSGPETYDASTSKLAMILFSSASSPSFLYAFEAAAVLILAALVGAVVLAKKEL